MLTTTFLRTWVLSVMAVGLVSSASAQFVLQGAAPSLSLTTFASGLNFPVGMAELPDGSVVVGVSNGVSFYAATSGRILRLVDADDDGVAEVQQTIAATVPGASPTAVRRAGDLLFVTGQAQPIVIYRLGGDLAAPLVQVGRIDIAYPGAWQHGHSALAARLNGAGQTELFFQVGSEQNFAASTQTVALTSTVGVAGALEGDSIYRLRLTDTGSTVVGVDLTHIATGLRNAAGMAFQPGSGDFYIAENGIDGIADPNEPLSADELNVIPAADIGGAVEDFGFPTSYVEYRTGTVVGGTGIQPLVTFQPVPLPQTGAESEGPNDIVFASAAFGAPLTGRAIIGFHGRFSSGGLANEENPLVAVNVNTGQYQHVVSVTEPGVGHLDGLMARGDNVFVADLSTNGQLSSLGANRGAIYRIRFDGTLAEGEGISQVRTELHAPRPNPARNATTLAFETSSSGPIRLSVFDVRGREVAVLAEGSRPAGGGSAMLDTSALVPSVYVARLVSGSDIRTQRVVVLR